MKKLIYYLDRIYNYVYASSNGYFWSQCILCGKYFGGHEAYWSLLQDYGTGQAVCKFCKNRAKELNRETMKEWQKIEAIRYSIEYVEENNPGYPYILKGRTGNENL